MYFGTWDKLRKTNLKSTEKKMDETNCLQSPSKSGSFKKTGISAGLSQKCRKRGSMRKLPRLTKVFEFEKSFLVPQSVQVNVYHFYIRYLIISRKQHEISKMNWYENAKVHGLSMDRLIRNVLPLDSGTIENVFVHS